MTRFLVEVDNIKSVANTHMIPNKRKINASLSGELNFFIQQKYRSVNKCIMPFRGMIDVSVPGEEKSGVLTLGLCGHMSYNIPRIPSLISVPQ